MGVPIGGETCFHSLHFADKQLVASKHDEDTQHRPMSRKLQEDWSMRLDIKPDKNKTFIDKVIWIQFEIPGSHCGENVDVGVLGCNTVSIVRILAARYLQACRSLRIQTSVTGVANNTKKIFQYCPYFLNLLRTNKCNEKRSSKLQKRSLNLYNVRSLCYRKRRKKGGTDWYARLYFYQTLLVGFMLPFSDKKVKLFYRTLRT
jgi:hypothetical protein